MSNVEYCKRLRTEISRLLSSLPTSEQVELLSAVWAEHTSNVWSPQPSPVIPLISGLGTLIASLMSARSWTALEHLEIFQNPDGSLALVLRLSAQTAEKSPTSGASETIQDILK